MRLLFLGERRLSPHETSCRCNMDNMNKPDHHLPTTNRRRFLRALAGDLLGFADELSGRPQLAMNDLPELTDTALARIVPVISPGVAIVSLSEGVGARYPDGEIRGPLFESGAIQLFLFNRINGETALGQMAHELAAEFSLSPEASLAQTRELFLCLVRLGVCVPSNLVE